MILHELSEVLDSPRFVDFVGRYRDASVITDGTPICKKLASELSEAKKRHTAWFLKMLQHKIKKTALLMVSGVEAEAAIYTAEAVVCHHLCKGAKIDYIYDSSEISKYLESFISELLPFVRLLFPERENISDFEDICNALDTTKSSIDSMMLQHDKLMENSLATITQSSVFLNQTTAECQNLVDLFQPLAAKHVNTFSTYIGEVVESLSLKLQIIELETRLFSYRSEQTRTFTDTQELVRELDQAITAGRNSLLLFQQLGPSLSNLAAHYQQILTRLSFVQEDIAQLSLGVINK